MAEKEPHSLLSDKTKKRVFEIIQIGAGSDKVSIGFDIFISVVIFLNLFVTLAQTFNGMEPYMRFLKTVDTVTMCIFGVEYALRVWTAEYLFPSRSRAKARLAYMTSFYGVVEILTFVPYFLPIFFPTGIIALRMLRVVRIFRLFRVNAYSDAFNVIADVIRDKRNQILSSVSLVLILMVASSLCMYSLENEAQPEVFENALSGIWWAGSTLLTVGYGDIYPVTVAGKMVGTVIAFLGVGMVAIPTGIISAGFVEQYTRIKTLADYSEEADIRFISLKVYEGHSWANARVDEMKLPVGLLLIVIKRGDQTIVPHGSTVLLPGDSLVLGAEGFKEDVGIKLRELQLKESHPWVGRAINELDISRQTLIIMVRRGDKVMVPNGRLVFRAGDIVVLYSKKYVRDSIDIDM